MKSLNTYITEKLILNKNTFKKREYKYFPKTRTELKKIIKQLLKEHEDQDVIDLNDIDTSEITDMSGLFYNRPIIKIDISGWDVSNVTDIYGMFFDCKNLKSIGDISGWNVSNVKDMRCMFFSCKKLKDVGDLSNWNVSNTNEITRMFTDSGITNIPKWYKK